MAKESDDEREQRIEAHAKAAAANDPDYGKEPAARKKREQAPPEIYRAQAILHDLIDELDDVEEKLAPEPAMAAVISMIRSRLRKAADTLFE